MTTVKTHIVYETRERWDPLAPPVRIGRCGIDDFDKDRLWADNGHPATCRTCLGLKEKEKIA